MRKSEDVYGEPEVKEIDGAIVRIFRPILTEEERARRMERIKWAAARLIIAEQKVMHELKEKERTAK